MGGKRISAICGRCADNTVLLATSFTGVKENPCKLEIESENLGSIGRKPN